MLSDLFCLSQEELWYDGYIWHNWALGWILMFSNKKSICVYSSLLVVVQGLMITSFISLSWLAFTQGHNFEMDPPSCLIFRSFLGQIQWFTDPSALWHTLVHGWEWEHWGNSYRTCTTVNGCVQCRPRLHLLAAEVAREVCNEGEHAFRMWMCLGCLWNFFLLPGRFVLVG